MKASKDNIREVLGQHAAGIRFTEMDLHNGFALEGFLERIALEDLMHQFHVYYKDGTIRVITTGRLSVESKV